MEQEQRNELKRNTTVLARNGAVGKDEGRDVDRLQKTQYDGIDIQ